MAITLVSEMSGRAFYSRQYPARSVNGHNPDWADLRQSDWYIHTVAVESPVIAPAAYNELYLGGGVTLSVSQRLVDVTRNRRMGVIRIDLDLSTLYRDWAAIAERENDVFAVTDHTGQLVYASSADFLAAFPLLTTPDTALWQKAYRVGSHTASDSGFTFFYLADPSLAPFNAWLLYGVPMLFLLLCSTYAALFITRSSRAITQPVLKLKAAMLQGQQKDLSARCEPLAGEMGELSEAFNDLMGQMGALVGEVAATEQEKARLAYEVLQSKLNPHFLYNTMNAIRWKADLLGAREVSQALESLVSLLRFAIKTTSDTVPFALELEQLENYIQVMRVRYGNSIDVAYDIDDACMEYQCLKFLFQPIVENCFIHAFKSGAQHDKSIWIKAWVEPAGIHIAVEDNGDGIAHGRIESLFLAEAREEKALFGSIGIDNVHQRLRSLFGGAYGIAIESEPGAYTRVTALIPQKPLSAEPGCGPAEDTTSKEGAL